MLSMMSRSSAFAASCVAIRVPSARSLNAASSLGVGSVIRVSCWVNTICCCWHAVCSFWRSCLVCANACSMLAAGLCSPALLHCFCVLLLLRAASAVSQRSTSRLSAPTPLSLVSLVAQRGSTTCAVASSGSPNSTPPP